MARRKGTVSDLILLPWWVSAVLAVLAYFALAFLAPAYFSKNPYTVGIGQGLEQLATLVAGVLAFLALLSAVRSIFIARKFDKQKGLADIRALSWREFEMIVGEAFRRRGYQVVETGEGADGGIDLVIRKDGQKLYVQCKQWKQRTVGVKPVRELFGVISARGADGGVFVTSGAYTSDAREFAASCGIELIDGPVLERMVREVHEVHPDSDAASNRSRHFTTWSNGSEAPSCPACGSPMVGRTAKRGANAGKSFWGCSKYPQCRGTRDVA